MNPADFVLVESLRVPDDVPLARAPDVEHHVGAARLLLAAALVVLIPAAAVIVVIVVAAVRALALRRLIGCVPDRAVGDLGVRGPVHAQAAAGPEVSSQRVSALVPGLALVVHVIVQAVGQLDVHAAVQGIGPVLLVVLVPAVALVITR